MIYKVQFKTFAIMEDDSIGNIPQSEEYAYIDSPLEKVAEVLNEELSEERRVCYITRIDTMPNSRCIIFD